MAYVYEAADLFMSAHERADDIPLIIAHLRRMGIPSLLDQHMPAGGLWGGLSPGWVTTLWLTHILSQSDAKLRHVQPWVATHPDTLRASLGHDVPPADVHDLRLRDVLQALSNDTIWGGFELALNRHLLQSYELDIEQISLQRTDGWAWYVLPEGMLQVGPIRGWRPGVLKLNILHAALGPLGLPLATAVSGVRSGAEGGAVTLVHQAQAGVGRPGVLFTGDELRSLDVRAAVQAAGGTYLCKLPEPVAAGQGLTAVGRTAQPLLLDLPDGEGAEGYAWNEGVVADGEAGWDERRILLRVQAQARQAEERLRERLAQACAALAALGERRRGKRRPRTLPALHQAVQEVLESYHVQGLLTLQFDEEVEERTVRRYRGRPTAVRVQRDVQVAAVVDEAAVQAALAQLAWELYATNVPEQTLAAAWFARAHPVPAPSFERMSGRPVSLTPSTLQHEAQVVGLVRLLSLGLRALVLLEAAVYQRLVAEEAEPAQSGERFADAFDTRRRVAQQAGERLLDAFRDIAVISGRGARTLSVTPLNPLQRRVLHMLKLPPEIYS